MKFLISVVSSIKVYLVESSMATSSSVCAVCDLQHQTTQSTHWCTECEEPLCADCKKHHNILKATRNHKTISISDYQLLPSVVTDINQHCVYHNEMYQLYCIMHEIPICNKCVKDHGKCGEILSLDEIVRDIKTSESFIDLEQSVEDLFDNTMLICQDRESKIESITDQKKKITAHICDLKTEVIQHVEKLAQEFIKELDQIELDCCDPFRSIVSSLRDKAKEINQMKSEIQNTKKYASNLQAFLSLNKIQAKTIEYEKHLQSSIENRNLAKITIESTIDIKIQDSLTVDRFGSIKVKKSPCANIDINRRKDRQAQIVVPQAMTFFNDVELELKRKLNTTCTHPNGCCITKKGDFLFTDYNEYNEKTVAVNAKGEIEYIIPLSEQYGSYDVVHLIDTKVVVSTGYGYQKSGIIFIDLTKMKVIKFIDLTGYPFGIAYDGKSLICCVANKDLHVISCSDYSITTIPNTASPCYSYVSTHDDKIFLTNPDECKVTCCLYSGALVWEFKDESVLNRPRGITIDNNGHVFVAGENTCNVVVISPDGKQCRQLLNKEDGLDKPTAIFFDKVRKQMLVTNQTQNEIEQFAYVYNVS